MSSSPPTTTPLSPPQQEEEAGRQQSSDEQQQRQHNNASSWSSASSSCWTYSIGLICWTLPILLWDGIRLLCFVIVLLPGFVRFGWYYWFAAKRKSVRYDDQSCRQTLDIYLPTTTTTTSTSAKTHRNTTTRRRPSSPSSVAERGLSSSATMAEEHDSASIQEPLLSTQQQQQDDGGAQQQEQRPSGDVGGDGGGGGGVPVVIFVTGGAWMIGYKMWGALLARCLTATGCMVVIPDYRNFFPICGGKTVRVENMVDDVTAALNWLHDNIADYGGNPDRFVLCGQSAGGHLAMMTLLQNAAATTIAEAKGATTAQRPNKLNFDVPQVIRGVICLSSPFDLRAMLPTFARHGMTERLIRDEMFGGRMRQYDPVQWVGDFCNHSNSSRRGRLPPPQQQGETTTTAPPLSPTTIAAEHLRRDQRAPPSSSLSLQDALVPIRLYHGGADRTVPHDSMTAFRDALRRAGVVGEQRVRAHSYPNWSHTHAILEGPMDADHAFHKHVFNAVREWTTTTMATTATSEDDEQPTRTVHQDDDDDASSSGLLEWPDEDAPVLQRLCPRVLCQLAHHVNPF